MKALGSVFVRSCRQYEPPAPEARNKVAQGVSPGLGKKSKRSPGGATQVLTQYVIVWEFRIRPEEESEFLRHYGPDGSWARFFRNGEGYIRTELVRDVADQERFLTLDYWGSEDQFKAFRERHLAEYERLDKELEGLAERETRLGAFQADLARARS